MELEILDCQFLQAEDNKIPHDIFVLRIPVRGKGEGRFDAIVRLEVQCYVPHLDGTALSDTLGRIDGPKTLRQALTSFPQYDVSHANTAKSESTDGRREDRGRG